MASTRHSTSNFNSANELKWIILRFWTKITQKQCFFRRYLQWEIVNKQLIYKSAAMHHLKLHLVLSWKHYRNSQNHLIFTLKTAATFAGSVFRHPVCISIRFFLMKDLKNTRIQIFCFKSQCTSGFSFMRIVKKFFYARN